MSRLTNDPVESARQYWLERGWNQTVGGMTVVAAISRADQILLKRANAVLRPMELTFARYQVLGMLEGLGATPLGYVAQHLWITPATVTKSIDGLEATGFIRRRPHPTDARTTLAEITAKGRRVYQRALQEMNDEVFATVGLSDEEAQQLVVLIGKIRHEAGDVVGVIDAAPHWGMNTA